VGGSGCARGASFSRVTRQQSTALTGIASQITATTVNTSAL
jgi:hypothetical protein